MRIAFGLLCALWGVNHYIMFQRVQGPALSVTALIVWEVCAISFACMTWFQYRGHAGMSRLCGYVMGAAWALLVVHGAIFGIFPQPDRSVAGLNAFAFSIFTVIAAFVVYTRIKDRRAHVPADEVDTHGQPG